MDLLRAGLSAAAAAKPLPTFKGVPFNPTAFSFLVSSFVLPGGPQLGSIGRRVGAFTPDLLGGPTPRYFGNRVCPWAHRAFLALAEKGALDKIDYVHIDLKAPKPTWYQVSGGRPRLRYKPVGVSRKTVRCQPRPRPVIHTRKAHISVCMACICVFLHSR